MFNLGTDAVKPYIPHKFYFNDFFANALPDNFASSTYQRFTRSVMTLSLHISNSRTKPAGLDF